MAINLEDIGYGLELVGDAEEGFTVQLEDEETTSASLLFAYHEEANR